MWNRSSKNPLFYGLLALFLLEAVEELRPGKSLLRTSESSRNLDSALFLCFEKKFLGFLYSCCFYLGAPELRTRGLVPDQFLTDTFYPYSKSGPGAIMPTTSKIFLHSDVTVYMHMMRSRQVQVILSYTVLQKSLKLKENITASEKT